MLDLQEVLKGPQLDLGGHHHLVEATNPQIALEILAFREFFPLDLLI